VFSDGLIARSVQVLPLQFSDHHAVWVELGR